MNLVTEVARSDTNILLVGETGAGKNRAARVLHENSLRSAGPFVQIDCAGLSESRFDREVCGPMKGRAGARSAQADFVESARGGTVLLDHIEDLTPALQAKLLGVLDANAEGTPVLVRRDDVRWLATSRRFLLDDVRLGSFRADLYYRLAEVVLHIPPLRERTSDIEPLADLFLTLACDRIGRSTIPKLTERAVAILTEYDWPGNIRELGNVMARSALFCSGETLDADAIWLDVAPDPPTKEPRVNDPESAPQQTERDRILHALEACHGNQKQAAKFLGISRRTLVNRIENLGLPRPRKPFPSPPGRTALVTLSGPRKG